MFLLLIFTRGWVDLRAVVRSEGSMSLKNPVILPGIDPVTVRLIAQRLNHYATPGPAALYVLLGNILITVSITYLLNVTVVKYIWENAKWIEIAFMKNLIAHCNQRMLDIIRCRMFDIVRCRMFDIIRCRMFDIIRCRMFDIIWCRMFDIIRCRMLDIIQCRIFCLPVCFPKIQTLRYTDLQFCLLFWLGVELGLSHCRWNIGWSNTIYQKQL